MKELKYPLCALLVTWSFLGVVSIIEKQYEHVPHQRTYKLR